MSAIVTVVELTVLVVPFTVKFPLIIVLSAIVVVPPAESIVRFPDDVVTVFASIDTLSIAAAPVTVSVVPLNVRLPESFSENPDRTISLSGLL